MKKIPLYLGTVLLILFYASITHALTINPNTELIGTDNSPKSSEVDLNIESDSDVKSSSTSENTTTSINITENIHVERDDLEDEGDTAVIIDASSVNTSADLSVYAKSIILSDPNIKEVNFEKDKVEITCQKEGKVLGFFNTKYDIETKVDSNGRIEVDYPWYAALLSGSNKPQVRQRMEKEVSIFLDKNSNATGEIELNASVEAKLANLIHTILAEELNSEITQSSELNVSTTNE